MTEPVEPQEPAVEMTARPLEEAEEMGVLLNMLGIGVDTPNAVETLFTIFILVGQIEKEKKGMANDQSIIGIDLPKFKEAAFRFMKGENALKTNVYQNAISFQVVTEAQVKAEVEAAQALAADQAYNDTTFGPLDPPEQA